MGEAAVVSDGRQTVHDEHALTPLLSDVDESIFNNVFAFGLREIQELGTISDTQAADELYNLALGLDRVSLVDVLSDLETSRNRLLARDDRPSLVTQLLSQRQRLQSEIEDLSQGTLRFLSLATERQKLAGEITRLEAENMHWDQQVRELSMARALADRWQRRSAIDRELAALGNFDSLPEGALVRFERLESRLALRRRRFVRLKKERRRVRDQIGELNINEPLCRQAPRLEALGEQQQWIASLETQVSELQAAVLQQETERRESYQKWGLSAEPTSQAGELLSQRTLAELRAAAKAVHRSRADIRKSQALATTAAETASGHQQKIETALGDVKTTGLTPALAAAGELVSQLRKRVQLDERLDQMSRRQSQLEEQSHDQLDDQLLPTWVLAALGALFVLGCALVLLFLAGLILPASLSGSLGWPIGFGGVLAAGAAGAFKFMLEHNAGQRIDTCHEQIHLLGQQIEQAKADRDELDEQLPRGGGPLVARLQAAEKELARLEESLPLESQREAAAREAEAARRQVQALGAAYKQARANWRRLLAQNGLPSDLAPRGLREYAGRRKQIRALHQSVEEKRAELSRRRAEYEALACRITQLIAEIGLPPRSARPLDQLQQGLAELAQQQAKLKQREELERQIARLARRQAKLSRAAAHLRQRRRLLMRAAGTSDEQEFRRRAHAQAAAARLLAERTEIAHEVSAAITGQCSEEQLAQRLAAPHDLEQLETQLIESRRQSSQQLTQAIERRGEMNQQLRTLVEDRQLPHKRIELGIVEKRLNDALDRWRVLTLCSMVLEAVRAYYEREHQPQALREASAFLQRLTGGRYVRVWTPLGEHLLKVDDNQGRSLNVEVLSRGTREQLFLALRLALVSSYARRGARLPLVLDDVLVNFDAGRAKAAAMVLRDFARQGHQILIFTCHEHIAKLFKNIKAEVRQLPDNGRPQAVAAPEPIVRRGRRGRGETPAEPDDEPLYEPELDEVESAPMAEVVPPPAVPPPPIPQPVVSLPAAAEPSRRTPAPKPQPTRRSDWSAEEFEGELADRVWRNVDNQAAPDEDAA